MNRRLSGILALTVSLGILPNVLAAQGLADYDYENLAFRGFSFESGYLWPSRVDPTYSIGLRLDLGYLGPGLRIVPGISYWSSSLVDDEVAELENRVDELILDQVTPGPGWTGTDLGVVDWSDLVLSLDAHLVWAIPFDFLSFAGGGISAHIMNGEGEAISGTFVEDLLDTVSPGFNVHGGLEYPFSNRFRLYGEARYEFLEDLRYLEIRGGGQIMVGPSMPGEGRTP
jgi:hypothetical protein